MVHGPSSAGPFLLTLTVSRTADLPGDIQRIDRLHTTLPQDGPDAYVILLTSRSKVVRVSNPAARTRYSPELEQELIALLGPNGVQVKAVAAS
jgi:hypothetical protein